MSPAARTNDKSAPPRPLSAVPPPVPAPPPPVTAAPVPTPESLQRSFLNVLVLEIEHNQPELKCGLITRDGRPVVFVVLREEVSRRVEIGCAWSDEAREWAYLWMDDGRSIGYPGDERSIADTIRAELLNPRGPR